LKQKLRGEKHEKSNEPNKGTACVTLLGSTVDGKNPAPVDSRSQVVPDFFHQQYLIFSMLNSPSANPGKNPLQQTFSPQFPKLRHSKTTITQ